MAALARADLERLLHARKLAGTLALPGDTAPARDDRRVAPTGMASIDRRLGGGWARGHVSEIIGAPSTGATRIAWTSLAAATRRGELAALIDPLDMFDPESAATVGFVWSSLLWVRGAGAPSLDAPQRPPGPRAEPRHRRGVPRSEAAGAWRPAIDRAIKALALVLQAEGFGLVVLDLVGIPPAAVKQLPFTTWRRVQRLVEGRETACVILHGEAIGRSAGGVTLALNSRPRGRVRWAGQSARGRRLAEIATSARVVRAQGPQETLESFEWSAVEPCLPVSSTIGWA
jgi:hypothetical protein